MVHTVANTGAERDLDRLVRLEQTRMVYHHMPTSLSGTMVGACLLTAVMWPVIPHWLLLAWLGCMSANQSWRLVLYLRFRRRGIDATNFERWARYWAIAAGISGSIWGTASVLFFVPDSPLYQTLLITLVFAIISVGVPLIASHAPSLYAFVFPVLLPLIARAAWEGETLHLILAFIVTGVMIGILAVGRKYHSLLSESLRRRFENEALAASLSEQNAELERARNVAEQLSRAKTHFFAAASHDLRQPLHAMGLFAAALVEKVRDPQTLSVVNNIYASVGALESLFNELLDMSKIDAGAIRPNIVDFALHPLLDRLHMDFEPEAFEKGLRLRIHAGDVFAHGDPLLLERILRNLIGNSIRYTERGGILVGVRRRGAQLRIEVWDTGIGIPADQQTKIFEEFYQLGNPERDRKKGLGLGLSIVKRISQLLDHPVSMRSVSGRGTVFRIDVPAGQEADQAGAAVAAALPSVGFAGALIMVIDDEVAVREGMATLLGGWDAEVVTCAGIDEALAAARALRRAPDLIVTDYRLREDTTGAEAIRIVRENFGAGIPAIMVTGDTAPEHIETAKSLGYHLLLKPVMPAKLRSLISFKLGEGH